jgi:hypothetical protein
MLAYLDNTGEALAGLLRAGNAGANTAADHVAVLDAALLQIPDEHRHGTPILIRTDTAGCSKAFLAHIRGLREQHIAAEFSVGWAISDRERAAIAAVPEHIWASAIDTDGRIRDGAHRVEITALLPAAALTGDFGIEPGSVEASPSPSVWFQTEAQRAGRGHRGGI